MPVTDIPRKLKRIVFRNGRQFHSKYVQVRTKYDVRYAYKRRLVNEVEFGEETRKALAFLKEHKGVEGVHDYLEFGVCQGSTMSVFNQELRAAGLGHVRLFGFDSFEGLPSDSEGFWTEGDFDSDIDYTKKLMTKRGIDWSRTHLIQGWFSDTCNQETVDKYKISKISYVNIDCDIYSGSVEALNFCKPFFDDLVILNFDDWNPLAKRNMGEKRAFDEFLAANPEFSAEPFGEYSYNPGDLNGKLFILRKNA